jgi:hypothetical protein
VEALLPQKAAPDWSALQADSNYQAALVSIVRLSI